MSQVSWSNLVGFKKKWLPRPNHHRIVTCTLARRQNTIPNRRYTLHYVSLSILELPPTALSSLVQHGPTTWTKSTAFSTPHFLLPTHGVRVRGLGRVRETRTKPDRRERAGRGVARRGRFRVSPAASRREAASRAFPESPPERIPSGRAPRKTHTHIVQGGQCHV
jgi:hypothetical protein